VETCHFREPVSFEAMRSLNPKSFCAADVACEAIAAFQVKRPLLVFKRGLRCVVTSGTIQDAATHTALLQAVQSTGVRATYLSIGDSNEDLITARLCKDLNVDHVKGKTIPLEKVAGFLNTFDIALSGRHHINYFLMRCGIPFLPLPAATSKIDATVSYLHYPLRPPQTFREIPDLFQSLVSERKVLSEASLASFANARATLKGFWRRAVAA